MTALRFTLTCPRCGADVDLVASGRVIAGTEASAIVRCSECPAYLAEFQVMVRLVPVESRIVVGRTTLPCSTCGTESGYTAHMRARERPCDDCKRAHAAAERRRSERRQRGRVGVLV